MNAELIIVYREGRWFVVPSDARTVTLFSSESAEEATEWRNTHSLRRAA